MSSSGLRGRVRPILRWLPWRLHYELGPALMSELRKRWVLLCNPSATIRFEGPVGLGPGFSLHCPGKCELIVGPGVEFRRGFRAEIAPGGRLTIGAKSIFTYSVLVQCSTVIEIGERCVFARSTTIVDGNHRFRDLDTPMIEQGYSYRPLRIGDDAAVMTQSTVLANLGERAFVGANSVVTHDIPDYTLAVGAPARPIEYFGPPDRAPAALVDGE